MTNASSMELLTSSGVDPKTAEALGKFVEKAVDKAVAKEVKSLEIAVQSRPQEAAERPAPDTVTVSAGIIAVVAWATLQLGMAFWLDNTIRSEFSSLRAEFNR